MATAIDPNEPEALNLERIGFIAERIQAMRAFVEQVYIPDVKAVAGFYPDWFALGAGHRNYLAYGGLPRGSIGDPSTFDFPRGIVLGGDLATVHPLDQARITESIARSYYDYSGGDAEVRHPWDGETTPHYTGPTPPYTELQRDAKYSWLKAPRYEGKVMEVGPLARMLVAYAGGVPRVRELVDGVLQDLGAQPAALLSTLGRVAARAVETAYLLDLMDGWLDGLAHNMMSGDLRIHDGSRWEPSTWPAEAEGWGAHEAPRGSLGHWVRIEAGRIAGYQAIVPSTWNAGPRDAAGQPGPFEAALAGTPVAEPERPLELLRTIHSFDPCVACAVHVVDARGRERVRVEVA